ncbi:phosphatidate cytidylyltransferase [Kordiimonas sp.]|uniref:phosphatidate cytidylyltransferase n=1 Tax=Kordiimonas sp. TaxID=1970157 RepID=UPI003A94F44F
MPLGLSDNLFQRIVSALLLLPPVLWVTYEGGFWFSGLLALGGVLMMLEWCQLTGRHRAIEKVAGITLIVALLLLLEVGAAEVRFSHVLAALGVLAFLGILLVRAGVAVGWWLTGIAYVALPISSLWFLRSENGLLVLWVFLITWATDVGGYFAGKGIGGPKLAPKISPKKTWAGLWGGVVLSGLVSVIMHQIVPFVAGTLIVVLLSGVLAIWAQVGDLLESAVKRHFNVKDSGGLIPGHGGLLDRVDGLVFVAPAVASIVLLSICLGFEF